MPSSQGRQSLEVEANEAFHKWTVTFSCRLLDFGDEFILTAVSHLKPDSLPREKLEMKDFLLPSEHSLVL